MVLGAYARCMGKPKVRPTFEVVAKLSRPEVVQHLRAHVPHHRDSVVVTFIGDTIELVPHSSQVHLWSPQLRLDLADASEGTLIRARFAPHPHVWSAYLAVHAIGAFGTIGAAVFGYSQHLARESPWALWALPIAPVLAALVWALAFVGQGMSAEQMYALRRFVDEALGHEADEVTAGAEPAAP